MNDLSDSEAQLIRRVLEQDRNLPVEISSRQERERQTKTEAHCDAPEIAGLIELLGYEGLLHTLQMDESTYTSSYKQKPPRFTSNRQELRAYVNSHVLSCKHCRLVGENKQWLDNRMNEILSAGILAQNLPVPERKSRWSYALITVAASLLLTLGIAWLLSGSRKAEQEDVQIGVATPPAQPPTSIQEKPVPATTGNRFSSVTRGEKSKNERLIITPSKRVLVARVQYNPSERLRAPIAIARPEIAQAVPASRGELTPIQVELPENSRPGEYRVTIADPANIDKPFPPAIGISRDGATLEAYLDMKDLPEKQYYLLVSPVDETTNKYLPEHYLIMVIGPRGVDEQDSHKRP